MRLNREQEDMFMSAIAIRGHSFYASRLIIFFKSVMNES